MPHAVVLSTPRAPFGSVILIHPKQAFQRLLYGNPLNIGGQYAYLNSVTMDGASNVWVADTGDNTIFELNNAGTNLSGSSGFSASGSPASVAVDGSGDVWYTGQSTLLLYELVGAAVPVVTPIAYGVAHSLLGTTP